MRSTIKIKSGNLSGIYLAFVFSALIHISVAQDNHTLNAFYETEYRQWLEHIENVGNFSKQTNFDVLFYSLQLDISVDSPHISGDVLCRFRITENEVSSINLNLHHALTIQSITGNSTSFLTDNDTVIVMLDRSYNIGDEAEIYVEYQGVPHLAGEIKGLHYTTHAGNDPVIVSLSTPFLAHYWWPCKDGPGDKADSVYIDISIPDTIINGIPLNAVSNGVLENVISSGNKKTYQWRHRYPIVPYYVMVAISNYELLLDEFFNSSGERFPLEYYVFKEHQAEAQTGVAQLPAVIDLFSDLFGSYPFAKEKYGMTQIGFYGAIENQTNTIIHEMSVDWFRVSVHELAHMWFGDMITCADWHHGWLNEGFATYCEALWTEHLGGFSAYSEHMTYNEYYDGGTVYLQDTTDPFNIFIGIIYSKGAYVLHMLRGLLGDSVFFESLYRYAQNINYRYKHANTEDFQAVCEFVSGRSLDYFFNQWIYDEYYPCYEYGFSQNPVTNEVSFLIKQTQINKGWRPLFKMPIQLQFHSINGLDTLITVWNDSISQSYRFKFSDYISHIDFDPQNWILKEVSYTADLLRSVPSRITLYQNFPNPFNDFTTIQFSLPNVTEVSINIYDIHGRKLRNILSGMVLNQGFHYLTWDGYTDSKNIVSSGVYFYQLQTTDISVTKKLILLK